MQVFTKRRCLFLALLILFCGGMVVAATHSHRKARRHKATNNAPVVVDYTGHIKPILEARCVRCHGPAKSKAGLHLDTVSGILKGGDSGGVIIPGDGAHSLLVTILNGDEDRPRMPPSGEPLSAEEVGLIKAWIDAGAPAPPEAEKTTEPSSSSRIEHWAFRPPVSPTFPPRPGTGLRQPNRRTALHRTRKARPGALPLPPRAIILRRVFIDLIGLPPTREQLLEFLADSSDDAFERVVDRLLESPQYGERWARHWMDVWRYSDADGRKSKADIWWSSAYIWRWRDWIVQSLNEDKGYDRMVLEMLAGDEVARGDIQALAATGFLVRNWFKLDRNVWLNNTVEHTAKAFLGLTIGCARCHDHKFDPISQKEYYRFRAFFEPHDVRTEAVQGETGPTAQVTRVYDARPEEPTWIFVRGDSKTLDKSTQILPGIPDALGSIEPVAPPAVGSTSTGRRLALCAGLEVVATRLPRVWP